MELLRPPAIWLKLLQIPYLQQVKNRKHMTAVQIEAPEIPAITAYLIARVLLQPNNNLHLIFDPTVAHFSN